MTRHRLGRARGLVRTLGTAGQLACALAVAACTGLAGGTSFISHQSDAFGEFTLTVIDRSGLVVTLATADDPQLAALPGGEVRAVPEARKIEVTWLGGGCDRESRVTITGNAQALDLLLEPNVGPVGGACPDVGITHALTLGLSAPVPQAALHLLVQR